MTTTSIAPLRKKDKNGELYTRLPEIEAKLLEISVLSPEIISSRCAIQDSDAADYLPSECLLHLVRANRSSSPNPYFETIYRVLAERVLRALPSAENKDLTESNIRYEAFGRFTELLAKDHLEYLESLDFFEIRFECALKTLRTDVERKAYREKNRSTSLEVDHDTGEFKEEVERAAGSFNPFDNEENDQAAYWSRLDKAIDALPDLEKAIIEMLRKDIPIESKEPGVVNIANALEKTPKTIRKYRDKAYATLRVALKKGE
jgi:hypothetical protein